MFYVLSDYSGASGQVQGSGTRTDQDGALSRSSYTRTVSGLLQKVL